MIKTEILTSPKVLYTKSCTRIMSALAKRFSKFQPTKEWVNKVTLSSFDQLFQIRACVISARKAKHLDVTTMFTILSCKLASWSIRARVLS